MDLKLQAKIPFTREAYEKLKNERLRLKQLREEVVVRLQAARELGDLSENGAYKYAKMELGNIGRQLRQIGYQLANGEVVEKHNSDGVIGFGSAVTVKSETKSLTFLLVSEYESNPAENKLSFNSPIGRAVMGKKAGDSVVVTLPAGQSSYTIVEVK